MSEQIAAGQAADNAEQPIAAALWDFDGTLVDTEPIWFAVEYELNAEYGGDNDHYDAELMVGGALERTAEYILQVSGRTDLSVAEVTAEMVRRVAARIREGDQINWRPGALELLGGFQAAGIPCALVSASYHEVLSAVLDRLPEGTFTVVVGGDDVTRSKPDPEPYQMAAKRLGVAPADCVVLEDSHPGTESGNASGAYVLAIKNMVDVPPAPRRKLVDTLVGIDVATVAHWLRQAEPASAESTATRVRR